MYSWNGTTLLFYVPFREKKPIASVQDLVLYFPFPNADGSKVFAELEDLWSG